MKSFDPAKFKLHAWDKKCHFGNLSEIGWLAGFGAWPCPVSVRSKTACRIFFVVMLLFLFEFKLWLAREKVILFVVLADRTQFSWLLGILPREKQTWIKGIKGMWYRTFRMLVITIWPLLFTKYRKLTYATKIFSMF